MAVNELEVRRSSASVLGFLGGARKLPTVSKYIDTSTCIGCKACEIACQEWNDLPEVATVQAGSYQTLPELHAGYWNLIRFNEMEHGDGLVWLMRKDQCMHCEDPGCLEACPAPGAIVQYANGIVDVNPDKCIGCAYCASGCPFNVPKFAEKTGKMQKCTLCVDRSRVGLEPACVKSCPTGCLHFGTKDDMLSLAKGRVAQLKASGFAERPTDRTTRSCSAVSVPPSPSMSSYRTPRLPETVSSIFATFPFVKRTPIPFACWKNSSYPFPKARMSM